ncbi:MAG: DUF1963 domain-containing protein [Pirellulaceae bacterium]
MMPKKWLIEFHESSTPITQPVTKFGGQPVWVEQPQWPLSRETGHPMRFIGQIALTPELGYTSPAQMAYLFITDEEDDSYVDGTWEPEGGENAVILQPGTPRWPTRSQPTGPTIYRMVEKAGQELLQRESCEFSVQLTETDDIPFVSQEQRAQLSESEREAVEGVLDESKIGGTPVFLQGDELPFAGGWQLLLQLDSCSAPFCINFGDAGIGYAFLNSVGDQARFLWQGG